MGAQLYQAYIWGGTPTAANAETATTFKFRPQEKTGAGNRVLLCVTYPTGTAPTISDTAGNTWPGTPTSVVSSGANDTAIWDLKNIAGGSFNTITITFGSATQTPSGEYWEFSGLSTTVANGGSHSTAAVIGTSLAVGSFTPTPNNDSNGGYLICAFFHDAFTNDTGPTGWVAGSSPAAWTLMQGDTLSTGNFNQYQPMASEYFVFSNGAGTTAINPGITATANPGPTEYNCIAIALPLDPAGGTPKPTGQVWINKLIKQRTPDIGVNTSTKTNFPTVGDTRVIVSTTTDLNITNAVDTDGTYVRASTSTFPLITVLKNKAADSSNALTLTIGNGNTNIDLWMFDISGAATGTVVGAVASASVNTTAVQTAVSDDPDITPTTITSLILTSVTNGFGPTTGVTSPAGAILSGVSLTAGGTGETDGGINSGDNVAILHNSSLAAQAWNWTISPPGGSGSNLAGSSVEILAATTGGALSGAAMGTGAGSFAKANTRALAGAAATGAAGTITTNGNKSIALTGVAGAAAAGSLTDAITKALTGAGAASAAGSLAEVISDALTGAAGAAAAGSFIDALTKALSGAAGATAAGSFADILTDALTGAAMTGAAGTLSVGVNTTVALPGAAAGSGAGSLAKELTSAVTGASGAAAAGAFAEAISIALAGAAAGSGAGSFTETIAGALTGAAAASAAGAFVNSDANALGGAAASGSAGTFLSAITVTLQGASMASAAAGTDETVIVLPSASTSMAAAGGALLFGDTISLQGVGATSAAGSFANSTGGGTSLTITGAGSVATAGNFANALSKALTGAGASVNAGALSPGEIIGLTGAGATAQPGTLAKTVLVPLPGAGSTASAGSFSVSAGGTTTFGLTGAAATASPGSFAIGSAIGVAGVSSVAAAGVFGDGDVVTLAGAAAAAAAGAILTQGAASLAGVQATIAAGQIAVQGAKSSPGASATAAAGGISAGPPGIPLQGPQATALAGIFSRLGNIFMQGARATMFAGIIGGPIFPAVVPNPRRTLVSDHVPIRTLS